MSHLSELEIVLVGTSGRRRETFVAEQEPYIFKVPETGSCCRPTFLKKTDRICYFAKKRQVCLVLNSYAFYFLLDTLARSYNYRSAWICHVKKFCLTRNKIIIFEVLPEAFYIDNAWGNRMLYLARERAEVEHAFSWLSTLGGAFSALGDSFSHCAVMAGKISWAQLKLAIRLGDPVMKSRCYLYFAISLAQQGDLKKARFIVRIVKKSQPSLNSICQGVKAHFFRLKMNQRG